MKLLAFSAALIVVFLAILLTSPTTTLASVSRTFCLASTAIFLCASTVGLLTRARS